MSKFNVGDLVRLRTGTAAQLVVEVDRSEILCHYLDDPDNIKYANEWRDVTDYVRHERQEQENTMTLYETKDGRFGTMLAKNSKGQLVLEMKGAGEVEAFEPKDVVEVRPYTAQLTNSSGHNVHYEVTEGSLELGDLVLTSAGLLLTVSKIDTRAKNPSQLGSARKVMTQAI